MLKCNPRGSLSTELYTSQVNTPLTHINFDFSRLISRKSSSEGAALMMLSAKPSISRSQFGTCRLLRILGTLVRTQSNPVSTKLGAAIPRQQINLGVILFLRFLTNCNPSIAAPALSPTSTYINLEFLLEAITVALITLTTIAVYIYNQLYILGSQIYRISTTEKIERYSGNKIIVIQPKLRN